MLTFSIFFTKLKLKRSTKSFISHPFATASVPLVLFFFAPASSKEILNIQTTIECGLTLKRVRDMTRTYSQTSSYYNTPCNIFYNNYVINISPRQLL